MFMDIGFMTRPVSAASALLRRFRVWAQGGLSRCWCTEGGTAHSNTGTSTLAYSPAGLWRDGEDLAVFAARNRRKMNRKWGLCLTVTG